MALKAKNYNAALKFGATLDDLEIGDLEELVDSALNEILEFDSVASAVNHIRVGNAATGNNPTIAAGGEADTGITLLNQDGEEIVIFDSVASAVNEITIASAATGNNPTIACTGEANTGITLQNSEGEEILILDSIATSVNEFTILSAATGNPPDLQATGGDTNIDLRVTPKGTGDLNVAGASGITSSLSNAIVPWFISSAPTTTTDTAAVVLTSTFTNLVTTGAATPTLADATVKGHYKKIQFITDAGDATLTPTTLNGGTTITFADIGDTAELMWDGSGWQVLALYNTADGTTAPVLA